MKAAPLKLPDINFRNIRKHRSSQNDGFEELTRQLVLADPPKGFSSIENRGAGADGGVEIAVKFPDGRVWGWQSKYFPDAFGPSEVAQLKKSFKSALNNFPRLERYYVAVPRNFSGHAEGDTQTQTRNWNNFAKWCAAEAKKKERSVAIELWDETYFVSKLQRNEAVYSGMRLYWFDEDSFGPEWFENTLNKARNYIGKRYRPEDHVDVEINSKLQLLRRDESTTKRLNAVKQDLEDAIEALRGIRAYGDETTPLHEDCEKTKTEIERVLSGLNAADPNELYAHGIATCLDDIEAISRESLSYRALLSSQYEEKESVDPTTGQMRSVPVYGRPVNALVRDLDDHMMTASLAFSAVDRKILRRPLVLVEGEAGAGKSHLLAKEVESHVNDGHAALFIPGRALDHSDKPEQEILNYLDIADMRFDVFLSAMESAALATGRPALIVIDGINESLSAAGWQFGLPVLCGQVEKFSRLAFCVSVRSSYRSLCIRQDLKIASIVHYGFNGHLGEAAKEYLDRHGIERFSAPVFGLNELLYNPLFLSTAVDYLESSGQVSFPRGMDTIASIIKFWLQAVEGNLIDKRFDRIAPNDNKISIAVRKIASAMAANGSEYLPYEQAYQLCEEAINLAPPTKENERFLMRLIDEGVLLDAPSADTESGKRVSFGFQKFSDFFVAEAILADCKTAAALADALKVDGKYGYVFGKKRYHQFAGLRVALLALTPIRLKIELLDVEARFTDAVHVSVEDFMDSLLWRRGEAITARTVELLERQRRRDSDGKRGIDEDQWFGLLLASATQTGSPINAAYLKRDLASLTLGERDASWSVYLVDKGHVYEDEWSVIQQLIDWAWVAPPMKVELDQIHMVATALALMTSTTDRHLRDCATKALASLLTKYPEEIAAIIAEFDVWDDPYVRERVLAAASGGVLYCDNPLHLKNAALAADNMVFKKVPVERHAWTRRYAQIIVDHAVNNKAGIDLDIVARSAPPYASEVITDWPRLEDVVTYRETARSIFSSVIGFVSAKWDGQPPSQPGDFGNYTMGGIGNSFSQDIRGDRAPLTREQEIVDLWNRIDALGDEARALHADLDDLNSRIDDRRFSDLIASVSAENEVDNDVDTVEPLESKQTELVQKLKLLLPDDVRLEFERIDPLKRFGERGIPKFSLLQSRYWVFKRALDLGWTSSLHEKIENETLRYSGGRRDHSVERIGKKYQHIAYGELIGYLADYHWYVDWGRNPEILERIEAFEHADIDPSYFSGVHSKAVETFTPSGFEVPSMAFTVDTPDKNMKWTETLDDVPELVEYLIQPDEDGTRWAMQRCYRRSENYMRGFESNEPFKSAQYGIELILVHQSDLDKIVALTTETIRKNDRDVFDHGGTDSHFWGQLSYRYQGEQPPIALEYGVADFHFARPKQSYSPKYTEFDHSGVRDESDCLAPHAAVLAHMKLRPDSGWSSVFVTPDGKPAFADNPSFREGVACFRLDVIEQFAEDHDLKVVWRVWVEKDGGLGTHLTGRDHNQFARTDYIGYFFRDEAETWCGNMVRYRE